MPFEEHVENLDASTEPSPELLTTSPEPEIIVIIKNAVVGKGLQVAMRFNGVKNPLKIERLIKITHGVHEFFVNYNDYVNGGMEKSKAAISSIAEYVMSAALSNIVTRIATSVARGAKLAPKKNIYIFIGVVLTQVILEFCDADPSEILVTKTMKYYDENIAVFQKDQELAFINKEILLETTNAVMGALLLSPKLFGPAFSFLDNHRHAYFQAQDETVRISFLKDVTQNYLLPKYPSLSETLQHLNWSQSDIFSMLENIDFSKSPSQSMPPNVDGLHAWAQQNLGPNFSYPVHESHEAQELQAAPIPISEVVGDVLRAHQWLYGQPSEAQKNDGIKRLETKYLGEFANVLDVLKGGVANKITLSQNLQTAGYGLQLASQLAALTGHSETASILSGVAQSAFGLMSSMALTGLAAGFAGISAVVALPLSIMAFKQSKRQAKAMQAFQQALMSGLQTILNTMVELDYLARIRHEELRGDIKSLAEEMREWFKAISKGITENQMSLALLQKHVQELEATFERFQMTSFSQGFIEKCTILSELAISELSEVGYEDAMGKVVTYPSTSVLSKKLIDIVDGYPKPSADPLILARAAQCFMLAREKIGRPPQGIPDDSIIKYFNQHYESVQRWALGLRSNLTNYIGPIAEAIAGIEQIKVLVQEIINTEQRKLVEEKIKIIAVPFLQETFVEREKARDLGREVHPETRSCHRQFRFAKCKAFSKAVRADVDIIKEKLMQINIFIEPSAYLIGNAAKNNILAHFFPDKIAYHLDRYSITIINMQYYNKTFELLLTVADHLKIEVDYVNWKYDNANELTGDGYSHLIYNPKFFLKLAIENIDYFLYENIYNYDTVIECYQKSGIKWSEFPRCSSERSEISDKCASDIEDFFINAFNATNHPLCARHLILQADMSHAIDKYLANQDFLNAIQRKLYAYRRQINLAIFPEFNGQGTQICKTLNQVNEQLKLAQGRMYFTLTPGLQSNTSQALVTATGLTQTFSPLSPEAIIKFLTDYNGEGDNILDYLTQCQEQLRAWQAQVEALHASFEGSQLTGFPALDFTISALRYRHQHGLINGAATTPAALPDSSDTLTPQSVQTPTEVVCYDEQCHQQPIADFIHLYTQDLYRFEANIRNNQQIKQEVKDKLLVDIQTIDRKIRAYGLTQKDYMGLKGCLELDSQEIRINARQRGNQSLLTTTLEQMNLICAEKIDIADTTEVIYANGAKANQALDYQIRWSSFRQRGNNVAVAAGGHMTLGLIANGDNGNFQIQTNGYNDQITDRRISPYFPHSQGDGPTQRTEYTNANGNYAGSSILSTRTVIVYGTDRGIFAARQTIGYLLPHYLMLAAKSLGTSMTDVTQYVTDSIAQLQLATATPSKPETLSDSAHVLSLPDGQLRLSDRPYRHDTHAAYHAFENTIAALHDMAYVLPNVCRAVLQSYTNPIFWLSDLTRQGLRKAYDHAQQMQLQLARALAAEVEVRDCTSPYSTCLRSVPSKQPPRVDGLRHLISYHRPSGQAIYTEEALEIHSPSNTSRTVGRLSLFGPTLCQFEDGSTNVYEQTGVYADNPIEATIYTEPCTLPRPPEPGVTDGVCHAAAQGCVTGLSQVAYQYMCQEGYKETTSYYVTGIARLAILWFMFAVEHYAETSAMDYESPVTTALMRACLSLLQLLFMMTMSMALVGGTRYAGGLAREAGWARTGHAVESIGAYVAPALTYVDRMRQQGFLNTLACTATGLATQHGVTGIGSHLLGRR